MNGKPRSEEGRPKGKCVFLRLTSYPSCVQRDTFSSCDWLGQQHRLSNTLLPALLQAGVTAVVSWGSWWGLLLLPVLVDAFYVTCSEWGHWQEKSGVCNDRLSLVRQRGAEQASSCQLIPLQFLAWGFYGTLQQWNVVSCYYCLLVASLQFTQPSKNCIPLCLALC